MLSNKPDFKQRIVVCPDPSRVGFYAAIFNARPSAEELRQLLITHPRIRQAYCYAASDIYETVHSYFVSHSHDIEIIRTTKRHIKEIQQNRPIPRWLLAENNQESILSGDYNDIRPVTAEVVPTLHCCFRCVQCSYAAPKKTKGVWSAVADDDVSLDSEEGSTVSSSAFHMENHTMQQIIRRMHDARVRNVLLTGGGEPLLNPQATIAGLAETKRLGMICALYTNGFFLSDSMAAEILATDPLFVRISIYGANEKAFQAYTRKKSEYFGRVLTNIANMIDIRGGIESRTKIALSFLVHPFTVEGLNNLPEILFKYLGKDRLRHIAYIRFTPAVDYFDGKQHPFKWMASQFSSIERNIFPKLSPFVRVLAYKHRFADLYKEERYNRCRANGWYLEVGPNADVYLCCEKMLLDKYNIGNLLRQSVDEIYSSRKRLKVIQEIDSEKCMKCPPVCKPHELNKAFHQIETERQDDDKILSFLAWRRDIIQAGIEEAFFPGALNDFES